MNKKLPIFTLLNVLIGLNFFGIVPAEAAGQEARVLKKMTLNGKPPTAKKPNSAYVFSSKDVDTLAHEFMKYNRVMGMSIAIVNQDKVETFNYGLADESKHVLVTNDTIYTIASFTKTFTGALAAIASVNKQLDLDAPFVEYFPEVKNNQNLQTITTRELLGHVSSFPFDFEPRPKSHAALVKGLSQFQPNRAPGSEYSYSNAGIGTVGYVLQNVYGKTYQEILSEHLLNPLKMHSTYLLVPAEKEKFIALGHGANNEVVPYNKTIETWFAAASLKSTISDMAKYLQANMGSSAFSRTDLSQTDLSQAFRLVHTNQYCFADQLACEQLAWQARRLSILDQSTGDTYFIAFDKKGMPIFATKKIISNKNLGKEDIFIEKTGSGYGMSSYMLYIPAKKIGVIVLLNKFLGDERIKFGRDILRKLYHSA